MPEQEFVRATRGYPDRMPQQRRAPVLESRLLRGPRAIGYQEGRGARNLGVLALMRIDEWASNDRLGRLSMTRSQFFQEYPSVGERLSERNP